MVARNFIPKWKVVNHIRALRYAATHPFAPAHERERMGGSQRSEGHGYLIEKLWRV
jgi:hypothetical protein